MAPSEVLFNQINCLLPLHAWGTHAAGGEDEFIFCGRLDNLCMSYCALQALVDTCGSAEALAGARGAGWCVGMLRR